MAEHLARTGLGRLEGLSCGDAPRTDILFASADRRGRCSESRCYEVGLARGRDHHAVVRDLPAHLLDGIIFSKVDIYERL